MLQHQKGRNCLVFDMGGQNLKIPAHQVEQAEIISKKTKFEKADMVIRITFRDEDNKIHKPVFNFGDETIRGVLSGIDELASESKLEKMTFKPST